MYWCWNNVSKYFTSFFFLFIFFPFVPFWAYDMNKTVIIGNFQFKFWLLNLSLVEVTWLDDCTRFFTWHPLWNNDFWTGNICFFFFLILFWQSKYYKSSETDCLYKWMNAFREKIIMKLPKMNIKINYRFFFFFFRS